MYLSFFEKLIHACFIQVACLIEVVTKTGFTVEKTSSLIF